VTVQSQSQPIVLDPSGRDVHAEGNRLREQGPVAEVMLPGGIRAWSVVGYDALQQVLADPRFAKDARKHWPAFINGEISEDFPLIGWVLMDNMTTADGADHSRLRKLTAKAFTMRGTEAMRPMVESITQDLLNKLEATDPDEVVDLKAEYAYPLPTRVVCDLFGVPEELRREVMRGGEVNTETTITHEQAVANVEQWHQAMYDLVDLKRRNPGDDLLSMLIAAQEEDGSKLSDSEMAGTLHLMLGAGSETTTNMLSKAVVALLSHPDQYQMVLDGRVTWRDVIEETLRVESPIAQLPFRFTTEEVRIAGVTIPAGDPILMGFAASGRDPRRHGEAADKFDLTRPDKEHLSFGYGIHHCIGAPLARLEGAIGLPALFERFPDIQLAVPADEVPPQGTFLLNGSATLPVRLRRRNP
jgi:cytochrome P450